MPNETPKFKWPFPSWNADWQRWQDVFDDLIENVDATVFGIVSNSKVIFKDLPDAHVAANGPGYDLVMSGTAVMQSRSHGVEITIPGGAYSLTANTVLALTIPAGPVGPQLVEWDSLDGGISNSPDVVPFGFVDSSFDITWWNANKLEAGGTAIRLFGGGVGGGGSTAPAGYATEFTATGVSLTDALDFTITESAASTIQGIGSILSIVPSVSLGQVTVELYSDSARLIEVFEYVVDLVDPTSYATTDAFGFDLGTAGTVYGTLRCSGVAGGATASVTLEAHAMLPVTTSPPLSGSLGNGLEDNGSGAPQIALAIPSGLTLFGGELAIRGDNTQPAYVELNANGAYVKGVVNLSSQQTISGEKQFEAAGLVPQLAYGAPTAGTWTIGTEILDLDNVKWRCTVSGTPGTWELADNVVENPDVVVSGTVASDGGVELLEVPVIGNVGQVLLLKMWARASTGTADVQVEFSARIFETTAKNGRDLVWKGWGVARQTKLTALLPASQTYMEVNTNDFIDIDEMVCVYDTPSRYELGRCSARTSGYIWLDEALVDAGSWAADSLVLVGTEWNSVPWINTDGSAANRQKILLEVRNDGKATDSDLVFYVQAKTMSMGVLR